MLESPGLLAGRHVESGNQCTPFLTNFKVNVCYLPKIQSRKSSASLTVHIWNGMSKDDLTCKQRVLGSKKSRPNLNYLSYKISTDVEEGVTHSHILFSSVAFWSLQTRAEWQYVFSGFWVTASNITDACWGLHPLVEGEPAQDTKHVQSALFPQGSNLPHVAELEGAGTVRASPEVWAPHSVISSLKGENIIFRL